MRGAGAVVALVLIEWTAGLAVVAAWNQSWDVVRRGHFRIVAWTTAALALLGWLANRTADVASGSGGQGAAVAALLGASLLYLAAQYVRSDVVGVVAGAAVALAGAVALALSARLLEGWGFAVATIALLAGAALLGGVTNGMLLGHWYLNQPGLQPWALARLTGMTLAATAAGVILGVITAGTLTGAATEGAVLGLPGFGDDFGPFFYAAWLALMIFTAVVVWMARRCIKIRSIQSATGLYYVALLTAGVSEFLVRYLTVNAG